MRKHLKNLTILLAILPIFGYGFFDDPVETDIKDYTSSDMPIILNLFSGISEDIMLVSPPLIGNTENNENNKLTRFPLELIYRNLKNKTIPALNDLVKQSSEVKVETIELRDTHELFHKMLVNKREALEKFVSIIEKNTDSPIDTNITSNSKTTKALDELFTNNKAEQYLQDYENKLFFLMDKYKISHNDHIFTHFDQDKKQ
ncbi:hypothetical protein KKC91_01375 [bacterium]|nr:hypothetical protein [bacterium]